MVINRRRKFLIVLKQMKIQKLNEKIKNLKRKNKKNEKKNGKRGQKLRLMMLIKNQMYQETENDHVSINLKKN